eukprot:5417192-Amphidinium_carterae.1
MFLRCTKGAPSGKTYNDKSKTRFSSQTYRKPNATRIAKLAEQVSTRTLLATKGRPLLLAAAGCRAQNSVPQPRRSPRPA